MSVSAQAINRVRNAAYTVKLLPVVTGSGPRRARCSPCPPIVAPPPISWISTVDADGRPNLAPYSFFNAFCEAPPIVGFASGGRKDSQRNAEGIPSVPRLDPGRAGLLPKLLVEPLHKRIESGV
jgi:hypothetical protein